MSEVRLPITDFLSNYARTKPIRAHMPGHKGKPLPGFPALSAAFPYDITEIAGADSLFEADGILLEAEARTAALYGSGGLCYSAGGSTLCIQAMLAQMQTEGRTVIAARTVHRAFLNACVLLGLQVRWIFPEDGNLLSGHYTPAQFSSALRASVQAGERPCVYVTSPDYLGGIQDIAALSAVCRGYDAPLLVDNAHGAHLAFLPENRHPIALGADYCCDSAHKMLPALTGGAWLHCREAEKKPLLKQHMQLFGSTSPSYLILQSLEASTHWLRSGGIERIRRTAAQAEALRAKLPQYRWLGSEPFHLSAAADGIQLAAALRRHGVECEYADKTCLVLLLSPMTEEWEFSRLAGILAACDPGAPAVIPDLPEPPEQAMTLREAALSRWEQTPLTEAAGRICGPVQVPCPPAIPVVMSGERITPGWCNVLEFYSADPQQAGICTVR
ncbi:MAG: amino acid decarboxylase [Oscillospiraceae bacterium]|nr:amino acid decarboxylase [Oscillospiraceae bacterium]